MPDAAVLLLAGGRATRFPGKLERLVGGEPLVLRVYERLRGRWPVYVLARGTFDAAIDARLDCPVLLDRWPDRGPLGALVSACGSLREALVFAVAADLPNAGLDLLEALYAAMEAGDEAVVPRHEGGIEPLAALYDRRAAEREGLALLAEGRLAVRGLIERLNARFLDVAGDRFVNVNAPADLEGVR